MGACISSNQSKESQKSTVMPPANIKAQINEQLRGGLPTQSEGKPFSREKDSNLNRAKGEGESQGVESKQVGLQGGERGEDLNSSSLNAVEVGNDSGVRVIRHVVISKNCLNMLEQSARNKSFKSQQNTSTPSLIINQQQPTFQLSPNPIQTIQSRIQHIDQNMLGKGLTPADNKMIELTLLVTKPLNLSAVKFKNGSTYYGEWCKGQREGYGVLIWQDGSKYEGEWHLNCSEGQGKLFYNKREHYQGQFLRNGRHGYGVYVNNQKSYKGEWKNDKKEGRGIQSWDNKQFYQGQWLSGKKNGYGSLYFEDGSYYKGHFCSNQIHGLGFYQWKNSRTYEGQWEHNTMCGKGILKWNNGDQYEGYFKNNKMHGNGIFTHADGRVSEGCYQNGKKQGLFVQINSQKKAVQVEYLMGKIRLRKAKRKQHERTDSNTLTSVTNSV